MRQMIIAGLLLVTGTVKAQSVEEWTQQKQTQMRYLAEQIAKLKVYAGYVEKGYSIVGDGLQLVDDIKRGEFSLHQNYFAGLRQVKQNIRNNWKVVEIMRSAQRTMAAYRGCTKSVTRIATLDEGEKRHVLNAWSGLLISVTGVVSELQIVTGAADVSFSDKGRLQMLDRLLGQIRGHEAFAIQLSITANGLSENRRRDEATNSVVKRMYK